MTTENKKILGYFGLALGLGLVGAMVYFAFSKKGINVDKTNVVLGEEEEEEAVTTSDETTPVSTKNYSQLFANLPKFKDNIDFQFKPLGFGILK
jgi:hypothetical protein